MSRHVTQAHLLVLALVCGCTDRALPLLEADLGIDLAVEDANSDQSMPVDLAHTDLVRADLSRADFSAVDLARVDLARVDLAHPVTVDLASASLCARALSTPSVATDEELATCGQADQLGTCHLHGGCPNCACGAYVYVDGICAGGTCGSPLDGSGCADNGYYSGVHDGTDWMCEGELESGCMLRRLIEWGDCS